MRRSSRSDRRPRVRGQASLTAGGTLNLCAQVPSGARRAKFVLSAPQHQPIILATSFGRSIDGERWAEAVTDLGDVGQGSWEILLRTRGRLRSLTSRFVGESRGPASLRGASSGHPTVVSLSAQGSGLALVVDSLPRQAQLARLDIGFTDVVMTGVLLGEWSRVVKVIAHCRKDKRELDMDWVVDGTSFSASAPVASMALGEGTWDVTLVNETGQRMPVRQGLVDGRDRRYDLSTPVQIVAFNGGTARVRGFCSADGRVQLSVVPVAREAA